MGARELIAEEGDRNMGGDLSLTQRQPGEAKVCLYKKLKANKISDYVKLPEYR